jgi:phosphoenolpyruvate carboxykinase (ATP)
MWHPGKYAELLAERIEKYNARVWLVNTGWSGGGYGVGSRMKLSYTRAVMDAIHSGDLENAPTVTDPVFGFDIVTKCPNVPDQMLQPRETWADKSAYDAAAQKLAGLFRENFKSYEDGVGADVLAAGPKA